MKTNTLIEESSKKWQGNEGEMKMRRKAHEAEKSGVVIKRTKVGERGGGGAVSGRRACGMSHSIIIFHTLVSLFYSYTTRFDCGKQRKV